MPGETQTIEVSPGVEVEITNFTPDESKRFDADYPKVTAVYTSESVRGDGKHIISDWFDETQETYRLLGQACKHDIMPTAGTFQGMRSQTGYGFRMIRPSDICVTAQLNFDTQALPAGLLWYGYIHNGLIGAVYDPAPLYLRKELGIGWLGVRELKDPMIDEIQLEINGKPTPVFNMVQQMGRTGRPATAVGFALHISDTWNNADVTGMQENKNFRFPSVEYLKPAIQYRSQEHPGSGAGLVNVWGLNCLAPLGLTFVSSDFMRSRFVAADAQVRPTIVAP